jgi:hypothetical protein
LKDTMERAGVQRPPAIAFVESQDWTA